MYQCRYLLTERDARGRYRKESWLSCTATAAGTRRMTDLSVDGLVGRKGEQNIQNSRGKTFHHGIPFFTSMRGSADTPPERMKQQLAP